MHEVVSTLEWTLLKLILWKLFHVFIRNEMSYTLFYKPRIVHLYNWESQGSDFGNFKNFLRIILRPNHLSWSAETILLYTFFVFISMVLPSFFKASFYGNLKYVSIDQKWLKMLDYFPFAIPPTEHIFLAL